MQLGETELCTGLEWVPFRGAGVCTPDLRYLLHHPEISCSGLGKAPWPCTLAAVDAGLLMSSVSCASRGSRDLLAFDYKLSEHRHAFHLNIYVVSVFVMVSRASHGTVVTRSHPKPRPKVPR